jgi:tetratricopeptide (TPR) repeat protein
MRKTWGLTFAALGILAAAFLPRLLRACVGPSVELIFINTIHPDLPVGPYTQGNLGVIQPTYASIYLYVAYRNLAGPPVSPSEGEALWGGDERLLTGHGSRTGEALQQQQALETEMHPDWQQAWLSAIGGSKPFVVRFFDISSIPPWAGVYREIALHEGNNELYSQYLNCPQDAFREADKTLKLRTQQFGEMSSVVQNWKEAQKMVFGNCNEVGEVPDDLPPSAPAIARADRAYQQAAAYFYAGEYDEAVSAFRAIAEDQASPWSTIAPYLVARALVRKATVIDKWEPDFATLGQAETQIDSVLANPRLTQYHHAAEQLRGLIEFRLHPDKRLAELANNLMRGSQDANLAQDLIDFKRLFNLDTGSQYFGRPPLIGSELYTKLASARAKSDLVDWLLTLRLDDPEAYSHSLEKWQTTHSSAWLIAALTKAEPSSRHVSELLAAARRVPTSSPAYCSVTFHSLRLLLLQRKDAEVRERLAHLQIRRLGPFPPDFATPPSTANLFLALRFALARNLDELVENALRVPATVTDDLSSQQLPETDWGVGPASFDPVLPRFDDDSLVVLNRLLPVAMLAEAARSPKLTAKLRREVALAAWTRAALLGNTSVARSLAPEVEAIDPELGRALRLMILRRRPRTSGLPPCSPCSDFPA